MNPVIWRHHKWLFTVQVYDYILSPSWTMLASECLYWIPNKSFPRQKCTHDFCQAGQKVSQQLTTPYKSSPILFCLGNNCMGELFSGWEIDGKTFVCPLESRGGLLVRGTFVHIPPVSPHYWATWHVYFWGMLCPDAWGTTCQGTLPQDHSHPLLNSCFFSKNLKYSSNNHNIFVITFLS